MADVHIETYSVIVALLQLQVKSVKSQGEAAIACVVTRLSDAFDIIYPRLSPAPFGLSCFRRYQ
jgi:hypothetical protein